MSPHVFIYTQNCGHQLVRTQCVQTTAPICLESNMPWHHGIPYVSKLRLVKKNENSVHLVQTWRWRWSFSFTWSRSRNERCQGRRCQGRRCLPPGGAKGGGAWGGGAWQGVYPSGARGGGAWQGRRCLHHQWKAERAEFRLELVDALEEDAVFSFEEAQPPCHRLHGIPYVSKLSQNRFRRRRLE